MRLRHRSTLLAIVLCLAASVVQSYAQPPEPIRYTFKVVDASKHVAEIEASIPASGPSIELMMPVWTPGNKRFQYKESYVELRVEVFNLPNHPIWSQPGSQLRTPTFGVINSTRMDSRQIQLGVKYVF